MNLFTVIVFYKEKFENSLSLSSLIKSEKIINEKFNQFSLLLYDNSPNPQKLRFKVSFSIRYYHDINNGGVSSAYNYAYRLSKSGYDWILFLDQDTELNENYFIELSKALKKVNNYQNVVSIVPMMYHNKSNFSPAQVKWSGIHRPINPGYHGVYKNGELMAIGSGMVLKISFITSIEGFNKLFWLDCLDRWIFNTIYRLGKKCYILPSKLNHQLSILDFKNLMNIVRYNNQIRYEALFMLKYKTFFENIFFICRLLRRAIKTYLKTLNINYAIITIKLVLSIVFTGLNFSRFNKIQ